MTYIYTHVIELKGYIFNIHVERNIESRGKKFLTQFSMAIHDCHKKGVGAESPTPVPYICIENWQLIYIQFIYRTELEHTWLGHTCG